MNLSNKLLLSVLLLYSSLFFSCRSEDLVDSQIPDDEEVLIPTPTDSLSIPDWTEATHSKNVDPNYSVVFNQSEVLRLDITIGSSDWSAMQSDLSSRYGQTGGGGGMRPRTVEEASSTSDNPIWVESSVVFNKIEWYNVGIRYKGNSSLQSAYQSGNQKLSFKLDFDEYEDEYPVIKNQRFYGFKQLNLNNNYNDASFIREKVASDLFREFGLLSAQTSFCEVYVNHGSGAQYFGLYTIVEEMDDTVIETQLGDDSGNLYKPDGDAASFASGYYDTSELVKKNNEEEADYSDVKELYDVINDSKRTSDPTAWKAELEACFDVPEFLRWLAANTAMQNWDTYGNMTHNYFLYNNQGLLQWIPWDNNEAFEDGKQQGSLSLGLTEVNNNWPLIRYIIDDVEYAAQYEQLLQDYITNPFVVSTLQAKYDEYYALLKSSVEAEEIGYSYISNSVQFQLGIEEMKQHADTRSNLVLARNN